MLGAIFEQRWYVSQIHSRLATELAVDFGCQLLRGDEYIGVDNEII